MKRILLACVFMYLSGTLFSQDWVNKMMDSETNFYDVQNAFNQHWGTKGYERGKGWKQYKRWEYNVATRTYPTGVRNHSKAYFEAWKQVQKMNHSDLKSNSAWQPVGPVSWESQGWNPGLGRVNAIVADPNNANTIYVATPSGGLWKSINAGTNWVPLTDNLPAIGASGLAIDPANSNILYLATGDGDGSDSYSFGVMKSTDGGENWETTSLIHNISDGIRCTKILIDPTNSQRLWVSTNQGLFYTNDAAESWSQSINDNIRDIEIKPGDSNVIYASGRKFYKSTDGGENFNQIYDGVPNSSEVNRLAIAVSEDNPDVVYMIAGSDDDSGLYGFYRSTDSGQSFTLRSDSPNLLTYSETGDGEGGQSWYDLAITASHTNANEIYVGGINVWRSDDGGTTWSIVSHWVHPSSIGYTHADIHSLDAYGNKIYCGSDGGIFVTENQGNNWTDLSEGLQISQFYKIAVSPTNPDVILTASQDNGTNLFNGSGSYTHLLGGDGNMALIDYSNDQVMYSAYPGGEFQKSVNGGITFNDFSNGITETGSWVTPLEIHPDNNTILFSAFENVWKVGSNGIWSPISDFQFSGTLLALKVAPSNPDVIYTSGYGIIRKTTNGGESWSNIFNGLPNLSITGIEVHPANPDELWVTLSGYEANSKVFHSSDGGSTWQNITLNLPNLPVNCVSYQIGSNDGLYIGTDAGVYYKDADNINWNSYNTGLPNVIVKQIIFQYQSGKVLLSTFGRGVWQNDFFDPGSVVPVVNFSASENLICLGETIDFVNQSININSNVLWTFEGGIPNESTEINPSVTYTESGSFSVRLWAQNDNGADSLLIENYITVLDTIGIAAPYSEDFENAYSIADIAWYVENEDDQKTWEINNEIGYQSQKSVWINNFSNGPNNFDFLNSTTFDLSAMDTAIVTMRVSFAKRPGSPLETLKILTSNNCGETWTFKKVFTSTSSLSTAEPTSVPFSPENDSEWKLLVIDNIQPHERTENFRVRLEFKSGGGNNIYVDDINIANTLPVSVNQPKPIFGKLVLFPNPAREQTTLQILTHHPGKASIELRDVQGRLLSIIWDGKLNNGDNTIQLPLKGIAPGIYSLSVITTEGIQSRQLIIQ